MEEEENVKMVCVAEDMAHLPDSLLIDGYCGHKVWVSQEGYHVIQTRNAKPVCMNCIGAHIEIEKMTNEGKEPELRVTKSMLDAMERNTSKVEREEVEEILPLLGIKIVED